MSKLSKVNNILEIKAKKNSLPKVVHIISNISYDTITESLSNIFTKKIADIDIMCPEDKRTIGLDQVRFFKKKIVLKSNYQNRLGIIKDADLLTTEASNSLLKIFEELPESSYILLLSRSDNLLPTINSRVVFKENIFESSLLNENIYLFKNHSLIENLKWIEKEYNKINLDEYLLKLLVLANNEKDYHLSKNILKMQKMLKQNVNKRLILENLAINIASQT